MLCYKQKYFVSEKKERFEAALVLFKIETGIRWPQKYLKLSSRKSRTWVFFFKIILLGFSILNFTFIFLQQLARKFFSKFLATARKFKCFIGDME